MDIWHEVGSRGVGVCLGLVAGTAITAIVTRWKRHCERRSIMRGDARDTIVINHHVIETHDEPLIEGEPPIKRPKTLRLRTLGQAEVSRVVPNGHLADVLMKRAFAVTHRHTLISMDGAEGSYLLETLTNFVCDRVANGPFPHGLYVMAPCCEPAGLAEHQPITILLISVDDLALFEDWWTCRDVHVEHNSDGARVLTLMEMARRYKSEHTELKRLRAEGKRTRYVETMYVLDLALDKETADIPVKPIPWSRFEGLLKEMDLQG
ncbi:hypothetical protein [Zavarzinella formosa]|uniref:hypothetical protein n=1 Tax=Zavarzinella formosa TaxID=360055 RepID=UPI0002DD96E4|nr:hypothetical protein [Zavarzinella formosa]